jgi:hypothetical protein
LPFEILGVLPIVGLVVFISCYKLLGVDGYSTESPRRTNALDRPAGNSNEQTAKGPPQKSTLKLLCKISSWQLYLSASCSGLIMCAWAMWDLGYSPWMVSEFGLSEEAVGFYFAIAPLTYMLNSVPAGSAADMFDARVVTGMGLVVEGWSFMIAAGWLAPFWPWYEGFATISQSFRLGLSVLGCTLLGAAGPLVIVPCLPNMVDIAQSNAKQAATAGLGREDGIGWTRVVDDDEEALKVNGVAGPTLVDRESTDSGEVVARLPENSHHESGNEEVTNLVASIFTFAQNLGGFLGPLIGSPLIEALGFRGSAGVAGLAMILHGSVVLAVARWWGGKHNTSGIELLILGDASRLETPLIELTSIGDQEGSRIIGESDDTPKPLQPFTAYNVLHNKEK